MNVLIINTGTELLLGDVLNTHLTFIAQHILPLGLRVQQQIAVPDGDKIRSALRDAFQRAEIVFVTGGLGPTSDDMTREIAAELLGLTLRHDTDVMAAIEARAAARGFRLTDRIPRQAQVPDGATVLTNQFGTAPGLYLRPNVGSATKSPHLFLLPGPPRELRPMFREHVLPIVRRIAPAAANSAARHYHIAGVGESHVEEAIGDRILGIGGVELGYCAMLGEVVVRVIGDAVAVAAADAIIRQRFEHAIFAIDETSLEETVVHMLAEQGSTIAVAESCTGGLLANRLTNVAGASAVFLAGYITYSNAAKSDLLLIEPALIAEDGAVSEAVARAMAEGARRRAATTHALAITGIAGPSGGTTEKPVGTVFIALASADAPAEAIRDCFPGDRVSFKQLATQSALEMLRQRLRRVPANT